MCGRICGHLGEVKLFCELVVLVLGGCGGIMISVKAQTVASWMMKLVLMALRSAVDRKCMCVCGVCACVCRFRPQ